MSKSKNILFISIIAFLLIASVTVIAVKIIRKENTLPVAADDACTTDEEKAVLIDVLANDTDADEDGLSIISFTMGSHGQVGKENNQLRYTPVNDFFGDDTFTYTIEDGNGGTATATVTVHVANINDDPVAADDEDETDEDEALLIDVLSNDTDADGDDLYVILFTQPSYGEVTKEGNSLRYIPAAHFNGEDSFTYSISDGIGEKASATVTITVGPVNDAPIAQNDAKEIDEDSNILIDVTANDSDVDGDALIITEFTQGTHGTVTLEGNSLRYTPDANYFGTDSFTYTISDSHGGNASGAVTITVKPANDAPIAQDDTVELDEDSNILIDVVANDSDAEEDPLTITEFTQGYHGTVTKEGNILRYTPNANFNGSDSFTYTISDGSGGTATATVSITVLSVNDIPVATNDEVTLDEDANVLIDVLANDSDVDGDTLTPFSFTQGMHGTVVKEGYSLRYTPNANYNGTDSFTYTISDGNGGTATATVSITVLSVNDIPVATNDEVTLDEDANVLINALANDSDVDGDTLMLQSFTQGMHGMVMMEDYSLRYIPNPNYNGADSFTYTISDGNGGTATATVSITVSSVNDIPSSENDTAEVNEDSNITIDVLANDSDVDGDTLTITEFTQGLHGTVALDGNSLRYNPYGNYNGTDSFIYSISDGNGGMAIATVSITVLSVNDAPAPTDDVITLNEDTNVLINVLANDFDVDGDTLTFSSFTQGMHGVVMMEGYSLRYTPNANYNGTDSFDYEISDGSGGTGTGTVIITVISVNDASVAENDLAEVNEDSFINIDYLANDSDVEGDTLYLNSFTQPAHGIVSYAENSLIYTPTAHFYGADSFTYEISDGMGGTATATVSISVSSVNDAPSATNDEVTLDEDSTVLINVLANDSDADGDTLSIFSFTQGIHGVVIMEGYSLRYTPAANYHGTDSFTYEISDGNGKTAVGTVSITVLSVNDVPVPKIDTVEVNEDSNILINVSANDYDADGDTLHINSFTQGAHGTVSLTGDSLRYTPTPNFYGADSFTYEISDGNGGTATGTVTVTVLSVNDAPIANNDLAQLGQDTTILIDVLLNDIDVEGDSLTISSVTQGMHGMVSKEGNSIRYTPNAGYSGPDSFTYTISDGNGGLGTATVDVTVMASNPVLISLDIAGPGNVTEKIPFTVTSAGNYQLTTSYYQNDCDTALYLYDASDNLIAVNDDFTGFYSCIMLWLEPGAYSVQIEEINALPVFCHLEVVKI